MAAVAFDTLKCARRLKDVGYTDEQVEVQAEIMAEAFVFNMESLPRSIGYAQVTKDYLDVGRHHGEHGYPAIECLILKPGAI